ncbi:hypothetical protein L1887_60780 [Cichorium endivia]|nr:hypothetical protein L1887_60780 [Cichorium endivia]
MDAQHIRRATRATPSTARWHLRQAVSHGQSARKCDRRSRDHDDLRPSARSCARDEFATAQHAAFIRLRAQQSADNFRTVPREVGPTKTCFCCHIRAFHYPSAAMRKAAVTDDSFLNKRWASADSPRRPHVDRLSPYLL